MRAVPPATKAPSTTCPVDIVHSSDDEDLELIGILAGIFLGEKFGIISGFLSFGPQHFFSLIFLLKSLSISLLDLSHFLSDQYGYCTSQDRFF